MRRELPGSSHKITVHDMFNMPAGATAR